MSLLIHSMSEFSEIIVEAMDLAEVRAICEIGAEFGGMSSVLADYAAAHDGQLTSVDPCPKDEFVQWAAEHPDVRHVAKTSFDAFDELGNIDAWVIDGDHNWYTVYNELKRVDAISTRDRKPLLAFMHDVAWPWARRDLYYAPERIPEAFRHPYSFEGGVTLDYPGVIQDRGFRGHGQFACAVHEGGPCNGVLTAVEDFIDEVRNEGRGIAFARIPAVFGLGILFDTDAEWAPALSELVIPWHENRLVGRLEENRLRNYLAVIDWQDRDAERRERRRDAA
ncbi:MAG TPA: class I SAM-dependent methyltransferase [Allosphingosinicella sp.]|nr:class I SAM-dependent methyltransferase [Allosphingosinicella sp.]